jgi:hypothetical protein
VDLYVILDLGPGSDPRFHFFPSWRPEVDSESLALPEYHVLEREILHFEMPGPLEPAGPFYFWGALTTPGTYDVLDVDKQVFFLAP